MLLSNPDRQPWRNRRESHPCLPRDGHRVGGGVFRCRRARAARHAGRSRSPDRGCTGGRELPVDRRVIAAARGTGADAIHPGYGFLSENEQFAAACADAADGIHRPAAVCARAHGLEDRGTPRRARGRCGRSPGRNARGPGRRSDRGGGAASRLPGAAQAFGRGRRHRDGGRAGRAVARDGDRHRRVAKRVSAFGDGTLYVERLVERPRHVEIQVLADAMGISSTSSSASARFSGGIRR